MIVLDASVCVEWALNTGIGAKVAEHLAASASLHAPHLVDLEVTQVLRRLVRQGDLSGKRAAAALDDFAALDVERYGHEPLLPRIWALRDNLSAYDAAYIALAEALAAPLLSTDRRLAGAGHHSARVLIVEA